MKPLLVLLLAFGVLAAGTYFLQGQADFVLAGNGAMSAMLVFTAIGHFAFTQGMMRMLPEFLPAKKALVYSTGVLELAAAVGMLLPEWRERTAYCLLAFFVLILPANIYAALGHLNYQTGTPDGPGPRYLWFRIPLQLLFMAWTWYFALYLPFVTTFYEWFFSPLMKASF
ncbi:Uncharacterized membrane protein [Hymenobacter gelipurpurascens]|uniref:Uncharacterized membrane protein n=1 Tax=Hymenobacter gelipurpurascens TaxID=89968 RepID=A0A212T0I8_9BACT|nr:hypothetical protein [Hymenobacter gelipurpurascens]SNC59547.1 Uncharacterized membrane protein [Hymenobacter gelipurpurascens]